MRFEFEAVETWPPSAWIARCPRGADVIEVQHGSRVEVEAEWFCEAVWSGEYKSGDFDRTDLVFGSGARIRDGVVTFVSAGSTVDRLQSIQYKGALWISNSLVCLLEGVGGDLDPTYTGYARHFRTIVNGIGDYERALATSVGHVCLTYFNNITWDGTRSVEVEKPNPVRDFSTYERYRGFLGGSIRAIGENMAAAERRSPYSMLGTVSSGYDSPTVAVLGRAYGLREAITFDRARGGDPDSGLEIARAIGVEVRPFGWQAWQEKDLPEVPFLAVHGNAGDIWYAGAEALLEGRVLMTGYHGDKVWAKYNEQLSANIVRGDMSGLSLSEYRLWIGFIHIPVPFMGVRQIREINAVSRSAAMKSWDVPGDYSRPICRRVVDEAGVPREQLAQGKRYGSVRLSNRSMFWSTQLGGEYTRWLRARKKLWSAKWHLPPLWISRAARPFQIVAMAVAGTISRVTGLGPEDHSAIRRIHGLSNSEHLYKFVFPWAVEKAKERYHRTKVT